MQMYVPTWSAAIEPASRGSCGINVWPEGLPITYFRRRQESVRVRPAAALPNWKLLAWKWKTCRCGPTLLQHRPMSMFDVRAARFLPLDFHLRAQPAPVPHGCHRHQPPPPPPFPSSPPFQAGKPRNARLLFCVLRPPQKPPVPVPLCCSPGSASRYLGYVLHILLEPFVAAALMLTTKLNRSVHKSRLAACPCHC